MLIYSGLISVLHCSQTACCKAYHLQTFPLFIVGIGCFRPIIEFHIGRMTVFCRNLFCQQ